MIFLQVLGGTFLLLLLVVAFVAFRFWRSIKQAGSQDIIKVMGILPPVMTEFSKFSPTDWLDKKQRLGDHQLLKKAGFKYEGDFAHFHNLSEMHLSIWRHPKNQIVVTLMEAHAPENEEIAAVYFYDVCVKSERAVFTFTNNPSVSSMPRPRHLPYGVYEGATLRELLSELKHNIPPGFKALAIDNGVEFYQRGAQDYAAWVWKKEQLTGEEIKHLLEPLNIDMNDELIEQLVDYGFDQRNELIESRVIDQLSKKTKMSAAQWEKLRHQLVVVHDKMRTSDVANIMYRLFDYDQLSKLEDTLEDANDDHSPCSVTKLLNQYCIEAGLTLPKRVASMTKPAVAQVYIGSDE